MRTDRNKRDWCCSYQADSERINDIANVFPLFFWLQLWFHFTSMTRVSFEERTLIGVHNRSDCGKVPVIRLARLTLQRRYWHSMFKSSARRYHLCIRVNLHPKWGAPYSIQLDSAPLSGLPV